MTDVVPYTDKLPTKKVAQISVDLTKAGTIAAELMEQANRAVISDAESYATGGDLIKIARTEAAKIEDLRTELVGPFNKLVKFINAEFNKTKESFTDVRSTIETKMLKWKAVEDKRLAAEAEKERKKLEDEALERAALETKEEDQEAVLDAAAAAGEEVVEKAGVTLQRGNYGSSTGTRKIYTTTVDNQLDFVEALVSHIRAGNKRSIEIGSIVDLRKAGLNKLAEDMLEQGVTKMPGARFTATDKIRVY